MITINIQSFTERETAIEFFNNLKANGEFDAVFIDQTARIGYSKGSANQVGVDPGPLFAVIVVPSGTPMKLDVGSPESAPEPTPTP